MFNGKTDMEVELNTNNSSGLPSPTLFALVVFTTITILSIYAGYYIVWQTLFGDGTQSGILRIIGILIFNKTSGSLEQIRTEFINISTPSYISIVILAVLIFGYSYYSPIVWSTIKWAWYTLSGKRSPSTGIQEGFLISPNIEPGITTLTITRRELLDKLRNHLFEIDIPSGIRCGTSMRKNAPVWEISARLIHQYLRRLSASYPVSDTPNTVTANTEKTARKLMNLMCEERHIIQTIIDKLEIDPTIQYSYKESREHLQPLLTFYETARIHDRRVYSRRNVDNILGISLGQKDPYNETELNIVNSRKPLTSTHDNGEDGIGYAPLEVIIKEGGSYKHKILQTQTNDINELNKLGTSHHIPRISARMRGNNDSEPYAPHLTGLPTK